MSRFTQGAGVAASTLILVLTLGACGAGSAADQARTDPDTLQILAGSELKDMGSILEAAAKETGVKVHFDYAGTLEGTQTVADGAADGKYDAVWFPSNRYLTLLPGAKDKVASATKIMTSPVILGVKSKVATKLGWNTKAPTWAEISTAAAGGDFRYGMANPAASNSGFSALVAVATGLANTGNSLTAENIKEYTPSLTSFFSGQKLTAGSSGWLSDKFQTSTDIDGIINYESVIAGMDTTALGDSLTKVTPADGVITADYPLSILAAASDAKKAKAEILTEWLLKPSSQQTIMDTTARRPAVPGIALTDKFGKQPLVEQPFPNTLTVAHQLIESYLGTIRKPSQTVFSLDTSGSMSGERIAQLKSALKNLSGADASTTGSFASFQTREHVTLIPFNDRVGATARFTIPEADKAAELGRISSTVSGFNAAGGTAIYDSLVKALEEAEAQATSNPDTFTSIVLMTDGENRDGMDLKRFKNHYASLGAAAKQIPVFVIIFGEGNVKELQEVASLTGGKAFDARSSDLNSVFREIRGYQ
ncbi:VWA domain-containing protein [Arthrobacter sp. UYCo732]|uniref:vWA domain-containing protein n=1 Tax=Arthrobacter sp. UYCo732 TaxID=3156336 RepID=UPI003398F333